MGIDPEWCKDAIFYEADVRGFNDTTRDGNGDLRGLIERPGFLADLALDCLWLMPIYKSPRRDDGDDIADFYAIDPAIGDVNDFRELTEAAHRRGMRILADLVINYTSSDHHRFREAWPDPNSKFRDDHVWSDTPRKDERVRIIFTDAERSDWTWGAEARPYDWHRSYATRPDLNDHNPEVRREMLRGFSLSGIAGQA